MTQDERIRTLAEQGWLPVGIAQILGMNEHVVRRKLQELKIEPGFMHKKRDGLPYGMTSNSYKLRAQLGQIVAGLMDKYEQPAVSSLTGLNRQEITHAMKHPFDHDWKLSQMERVFDCEGKSINDISR